MLDEDEVRAPRSTTQHHAASRSNTQHHAASCSVTQHHTFHHRLTHPLTHPPTQPPTHPLTHPLIRLFTHPFIHPLTHSPTHTHSPTNHTPQRKRGLTNSYFSDPLTLPQLPFADGVFKDFMQKNNIPADAYNVDEIARFIRYIHIYLYIYIHF